MDFVVRSIDWAVLGGEQRRCLEIVRLTARKVAVVLLADQLLESRMKAERCCRDFGDGKGPQSPTVLAVYLPVAVKDPGDFVAGSDWTDWSWIVDVDLADANVVVEGVVAEAPRYRSHPRPTRSAQVE